MLEERVRAHDAAVAQQRVARERLAAIEARRQRLRDERAALLAAAGLAPDGDDASEALAALAALCARHPACAEARHRLAFAEHELAAARAALEALPGHEPSLACERVAALEQAHARAAALAAEHVPLVTEAAALRGRVEAAKRERDVERALADCAAAEAALRAARRRDLHALVGDVLARHVQQATRDTHRPAVFHRARALFGVVTRGRHLLELHDGVAGAPAFRAVDTATNRGYALHELSGATRVQLLLAVRMAFVETQEQGARLPLLLDETLGTSDDHRARAVMDAVIALAAEGRQVFYFTAQEDEVARWRAALAACGAPHRVTDLARARALTCDEPGAPHHAVAPAAASAPPPDGRTHDGYGRLLGVPRVRAGAERAAAAHLWYVVDDVALLHRLLALGVGTWGQLETLVACGGLPLLAGHARAHARAVALARLLDVVHERAAVGRGRTVDRAALLASGAVSARTVDAVAALAARCAGSAELLVDALHRGEAPGFHRRKTDALREWLLGERYLDPAPPLDPAEIRAAALGAAAADVAAGTLAVHDVDALLRRVASGPGGVEEAAYAPGSMRGAPHPASSS